MDLRLLSSVGGFFALRTGGPDAPVPQARAAVPLARVYEEGAGPLDFRVDKVTSRLGAPEPRIGASVAQLGLAARLWSVSLGAAALYGKALDVDPRRLRWDPDGTSPDDLWLDEVRTLPLDDLGASVIDGHLVPLAAALRRRHRIAEPLLWGNAGSALAGAVREQHSWARRADRPDVAARALDLGAALFRHPELACTGVLDLDAGPPRFRRRSCCLYYRCPSGGLCGDCCFDRPPARR
ncbi:IucA/IucC family C-terminal-domain containing protein [Streptomyces cavernicola]|uniref:IucA/IucC family C-terminal-domain containing protein n=1 Tax=Streptomyces cavernicola TaxID=3043613 RepID=A0ABT6S783_9ACTN|nr:IucA/IucC family C-terminal-domain containing protein [Streptomyces sp. B-S-A6]MDI3403930.1 IucA/IucC family C-terminal-domain containing protein [Streptomyces sp. B-S-A6]